MKDVSLNREFGLVLSGEERVCPFLWQTFLCLGISILHLNIYYKKAQSNVANKKEQKRKNAETLVILSLKHFFIRVII